MSKISFFVQNVLKKHSLNIFKFVFILVGCALVLLFSGSSYITFGASSKTKAILYFFTGIYFFSIVAANIRPSFFGLVKKDKKIPIPSYLSFTFIGILLFALLSFVFNKNKSENLNTYISFILTILITYFTLISVKTSTILKLFKNTIFLFAIIDLVIFAYTFISKVFFPPLYYYSDNGVIGSHFLLSTDYITSLSINYFGLYRMYGVLWEPSILGVVFVVALVCDQFSKDKYTIIRTIFITLCVILTFSLSAYLLLIFYVAIAICLKLKGFKPYYFAIGFMIVLIVAIVFMNQISDFLAKWLPSVFSKLDTSHNSTSFSTRFMSLTYYLQVFAKNPVFGFGGYTATEMYHDIRSGAVTADTSTFGNILASFGFAGIFYIVGMYFGLFLNKKMSPPLKILIAMAIFISTSSQGQSAVLGLNIVYFIPLSLVALPKKAEAYNDAFYSKLDDKKVKDLVISKNDDGVVSSNIIISFVLKGISIVLAFLTIPIYLNYFNSNESTYGVWLAITSILTIITVFDFGMGNGLKNKLIKNIHDGDTEDSKSIISTTYLLTMAIGLTISIIGIITIFLIDNNSIVTMFFKGEETSLENIMMFRIGFSIIIVAIGAQFFLKNINYILQAHQKNAITGIFMLITNVLLLLFAIVFANRIDPTKKIIYLAIAYFVFLITPLLIANLILFSSSYKNIRPSFSSVDFRKSKSTVSISLRFFVVQIGTLFIWSINEWVILFLFGFDSALITEYNEYYKLFSLLPLILGTIIQQPIWSALSKADVENNKNNIKKYSIALFASTIVIVLANLVLSFSLSFVFDLWLGSSAPIVEQNKIIAFIVYSVVYTISLSFIVLCNAFSLFKCQIVSACLGIFVKLPILVVVITNCYVSWDVIVLVNALCYVPILVGAPFEIIHYLKQRKLIAREEH